MKLFARVLAVLLILAMACCAAACGEDAGRDDQIQTDDFVDGPNQNAQGSQDRVEDLDGWGQSVATGTAPVGSFITEEEVVAGVNSLFQKLMASKKDPAALAELMEGESEQDIQNLQSMLDKMDDFDKMNTVVTASAYPYYQANTTFYIVSGVSPNTSMSASAYDVTAMLVEDVWKLCYVQAGVDALSAVQNAEDFYPQGFREGKNQTIFTSLNKMYLDENLVYEGCTNAEVKFVWQDQEGNLYIGIWFANGLDRNVSWTKCNIELLLDGESTICKLKNEPLSVTLKAHRSGVHVLKVPVDQINHADEVWERISSDCSVSYQ